MKLKNKKTGEMATLTLSSNGKELLLMKNNELVTHNVKLSDLEEWEDYEKPKDFWFVDADGEVRRTNYLTDNDKSDLRNFDNYFETKEEAEKAVERLLAWKRLKDYNLKFNLDFVKNKIDFTYSINNTLLDASDGEAQIFNNMKIVFGGEG